MILRWQNNNISVYLKHNLQDPQHIKRRLFWTISLLKLIKSNKRYPSLMITTNKSYLFDKNSPLMQSQPNKQNFIIICKIYVTVTINKSLYLKMISKSSEKWPNKPIKPILINLKQTLNFITGNISLNKYKKLSDKATKSIKSLKSTPSTHL
jgi:hypothetical protein